jgi:hypothetical protein
MGKRTYYGTVKKKMKKLISNNAGYKTYVEISSILRPADHKYLKITTTYDYAKDPTDHRTKFEMLLTPEVIDQLKEIFNAGQLLYRIT